MAIGTKMDDDKKVNDLEEDEELSALRLAALATLKSRSPKKSEPSSVRNHVSAISSIVTPSTATETSNYIPFIHTDRVYSSYNGHNTWRKNAQSTRRRGGSFFKSSQRSNLIVISPVSLDDEKPPEEKSSLPFLLPQYKWSNSGNEDSMSPKTYRRTGPTRFNRHESGSDSSDSDMDNSDNDSCSNETVLQDEPSNRFSNLSPEESNNNESDTVSESEKHKTLDRRLSFHNLDSGVMHDVLQKNETTSVYNCLKNSYSSFDSAEKRSNLNYRTMQNSNDAAHVRTQDEGNKYSGQSSSEESGLVRKSESLKSCSENIISFQSFDKSEECVKNEKSSISVVVKQEVSDPEKFSLKHSETYSNDEENSNRNAGYFSKQSRNYENDHKLSVHSETKVHSLSQNDLRLELKKRVHDSNFKRNSTANRQNESYDNKVSSHRREHRRRSFVHSRSRENSRERTKRQRYHRSKHTSSRSRSSSGSSTSSSSSSSSSNSGPTIRSVPSVIKPVILNTVKSENKSHTKVSGKKSNFLSSETDHNPLVSKNTKEIEDSYNCTPTKISLCSVDSQIHATESTKRMPVHMRLGSFPRKRIIKMTKDVEAAFVNSSSDDDIDVNMKCKKQNISIVTKICGNNNDEKKDKFHVESPEKHDTSRERSRRLKTHR